MPTLTPQARLWLAAFCCFAALGGLWSLASPRYSGPDENAHTIRAVSIVRGDLLGDAVEGSPDYVRWVEIPPGFTSPALATCFAFQPTVSAECQDFAPDGPDVLTGTPAGRHPPAYYLVVGIPSLVEDGPDGIYLVRLVGLLVCSALLASAVLSLQRLRSPRLGGLGLAVAVTPMVLFVLGIVNPSAPEIAGAVGVWISGYVLLREAPEVVDPRVAARLGTAAAALVLSRALAPLWLGLIVGTLLVAVGSVAALRALLRSRAALAWGGVAVLATLAQVAWILLAKPLEVADELGVADTGFAELFGISLSNSWDAIHREMIGVFGWLDTAAPQSTYVAWLALVGFLVLVGLAASDRRTVVGIVLVTGGTVLIPSLFEAVQAPNSGFIWQGRYTLPLAVGVPLLSAMGAGERATDWLEAGRLHVVAGVLLVIGHVGAYYVNLRRYVAGTDSPFWFFGSTGWTPPLPAWLLLAAFCVAVPATLWVLTGRHRWLPDDAEPTPA